MNVPMSVLADDDKSLAAKSAAAEFPAQIDEDTERTKSSLARLLHHEAEMARSEVENYDIAEEPEKGTFGARPSTAPR